MRSKVGIISYGCGNVQSVKNAIEHCNTNAELVVSIKDLKNYRKLILPGVGAFDHAIAVLEEQKYRDALSEWVTDDSNQLLGICLGMQLLCNGSEESKKGERGLGFINADVRLLKSKTEMRLPNIGWSEVTFNLAQYECHSGDYYFVHSYGAFCYSREDELGHSFYGDCRYSSAISNGRNIFGYQFHPEKSHTKGLKLLKDFCNL